jgi:hypothetical protein
MLVITCNFVIMVHKYGLLIHFDACRHWFVLHVAVRTLRGRAVEAALGMLGAAGSESTQQELAASVASVCKCIKVTDPDGYLHAIYDDGSGLFQALMYVVCEHAFLRIFLCH